MHFNCSWLCKDMLVWSGRLEHVKEINPQSFEIFTCDGEVGDGFLH